MNRRRLNKSVKRSMRALRKAAGLKRDFRPVPGRDPSHMLFHNRLLKSLRARFLRRNPLGLRRKDAEHEPKMRKGGE